MGVGKCTVQLRYVLGRLPVGASRRHRFVFEYIMFPSRWFFVFGRDWRLWRPPLPCGVVTSSHRITSLLMFVFCETNSSLSLHLVDHDLDVALEETLFMLGISNDINASRKNRRLYLGRAPSTFTLWSSQTKWTREQHRQPSATWESPNWAILFRVPIARQPALPPRSHRGDGFFVAVLLCHDVFILLRFSQTERGQDSFSKQLYETMRDRSMCNDPNQNPVGPAWIWATWAVSGAQQSARKWYSKYGFCLHLQVLHVWFARDKGANYGFCEIASQEEWATLLSDCRRLNVKKTGMESENEVGPLVHKAENVWQKCGLSHGSALLVQALHAGDGACFAAGWHAGFRWEIISAKREEWKIEYGKRQPRRNTLNG